MPRSRNFEIPVTQIESPEFRVSVERVHDGLETGSYLPLNPEGDTPSQPANFGQATDRFSTGEIPTLTSFTLRQESTQDQTPEAELPTRSQKVKRMGATVLIAAVTLGALGAAGHSDMEMAKKQATSNVTVTQK